MPLNNSSPLPPIGEGHGDDDTDTSSQHSLPRKSIQWQSHNAAGVVGVVDPVERINSPADLPALMRNRRMPATPDTPTTEVHDYMH